MEMQSRKKVFFENKDYILEYQEIDGSIVLHCIVYNWTVSALKHGYRKFAELLDEAEAKGYRCAYTITPNPKFAKLFGGRVVNTLLYQNKKYEVIVWEWTR